MIEWSYGVTSCAQRLESLLPKTLTSLAKAGFNSPRLFIDGHYHHPSIGAYGNWLLAVWELYIRQPRANMYAIFQDDLVMCRGVREYLERCKYPEKGYLNLFTFATNENIVHGKSEGWMLSDQLGKGALALVFSHEAIVTLLKQSHLVNYPQLPKGHKNIDSAVKHALVSQAKWQEFIHNPSLVQHTGTEGTLGNPRHPKAWTFPGEDFDARSLL